MLTLLGSAVIVGVLVPFTRYFRQLKISLTFFSLPYVLAVWVSLLTAYSLGLYDVHLYRGQADPTAAKRHFSQATANIASREAGLGWAEFRLANYGFASVHFENALREKPDSWSSMNGAGWCAMRLGKLDEAKRFFQSAVAGDAGLASSWNGLGWLSLNVRDFEEAEACFHWAIRSAPLMADAYKGLSRCQWSHNDGYVRLAALHETSLSPNLQFTSTRQIACWFFFLAGVACHSWMSFRVLGTVFMACVVANSIFPALTRAFPDVAFWYNLVPLLLALGGHYLRLAPLSMLWSASAAIFLAITWGLLTQASIAVGLPLLCLPFNVLLMISLVLFKQLRRPDSAPSVVPLGIAVGTPEQVGLWTQKVDLIRKCELIIRQ